jgi:hypothetical protein
MSIAKVLDGSRQPRPPATSADGGADLVLEIGS